MKCKFVVLIMLLLPFSINAADPLNLKLNLEPGTKYVYTMHINQTRTQTIDDEKQSLGQEMLEAWGVDVVNRTKSGDIDLKLTCTDILVKQNFDDQTTEYDSDNPPANLDPPMKGMAAMLGTVVTARLTTSGKVAKIDGVDAMIDKMIKAMAIPDSGQKTAVLADLRKQWGTDAMKQSLEQIASFYPNMPITAGSSWSLSLNLTSGVPMRIASEYSLISRNNGLDSIDVSSQISSDSTSKPVTMGTLTMSYNIRGTQSGSILADEATGLPSSSKLDMHYDGTITVSVDPSEESQTLPISADGTVIITFTRQ